MENNVLFMLRLISSVVTGKNPPEADENINWKLIYDISKRHNITNLVAYPIAEDKYDIQPEIKEKFTQKLYEGVFVSENQNAETKLLMEKFEEKGISYMPLKGVLLQNMYPSCDMRAMVDVDILIKCEEYEEIAKIMQDLGYSFTGESDHEYNYIKKPFIHIELHKHLIPSYNEDMYRYFGDGWKLAKKCEGINGRYEFEPEDNFIYILSHFAKHYRDGGIGIKHVIDIWLLYKKYSMDKNYLEEKLKELNINEFYKNVIRLVDVWFENGEFDETTSNMTTYIINSGNFGTVTNAMSASAIRESGSVDNSAKFKYIKFIFPKPEKMKEIFPVLKKFPFILPVMWLWRVVRFVLFRREKISVYKARIESIDKENVNKYSEHMQRVGLDIYNGRRNS